YWATTFGSADTRPAQPAAPAPAPAIAPAQAVAFEAGQAAEPAPAGPPTLLVNAGAQVATWAGEDTSPQALLSGREQSVVAVWAQDETGAWLFYMPSLPLFANTLQTVHQGDMVLVVAKEATELMP
ncbi:MAG TPA: hypothetical protein VFY90_01765, partial [Tepidiformaceae bacterium]|nr:hypothetical protein [Tepidiformaceae bacterium]